MSPDPFDYDEDDYIAAGGVVPGMHDFDDDAICRKCGFDGAEWWHWKHCTYEGNASDEKQPRCRA